MILLWGAILFQEKKVINEPYELKALSICTGDFLLDRIIVKVEKLEGIRLIPALDHDFSVGIVCAVKEGTCSNVAYGTRAGTGLIGHIFFTLA
jgi:hypothetical protein